MSNARFALVPLAAIVCVLGGCESKINDENFALIMPGMTRSAVEKILGKGDDETASGISISGAGVVGGKGGNDEVFRYKDGGKSIVVTYRDNKVINTVKSGF